MKGLYRPLLLVRLPMLAAAVAVAVPSQAQEDTVSVRFLLFPKVLEPERIELVAGEGRTIEIKAPSNELSEAYKLPRPSSWVLGETILDDAGKPGFTTFGEAKVPSSAEQIVLLLRKGARNSDGLTVLPLDGRTRHFGGGAFLFFNASEVDIACDAAGEKFAIKPGGHHLVKPEVEGRTAQFMFYFRKSGEARPFFSSRWPVTDYARGLVFFYHDPETKRLRLHSIRDFLEG